MVRSRLGAGGSTTPRVHAVDRHVHVAGHVPAHFVEGANVLAGVDEVNRVGDSVADRDVAVRVARVGNPDAKSARPAAVRDRLLYAKRLSVLVGDGENSDVELLRAFSRAVVAQRQVADDLIRFVREPDCQLLRDIERSVGVNGEDRIKVADAIEPSCARETCEARGRERL